MSPGKRRLVIVTEWSWIAALICVLHGKDNHRYWREVTRHGTPWPPKLHYTALLTLYIVSVCGHPCGVIGAHASPASHLTTDHVSVSASVPCPLPWPVWCLMSCLHLASYNKHIYTKKQYSEEKKQFLHLLYTIFLTRSFVFKLKFWIFLLKEWEVVNLFPCLQITLHQMSIWYQIFVQLSAEAGFCFL